MLLVKTKQKVEKVWKVFKFKWRFLEGTCPSLDWKFGVVKSDFWLAPITDSRFQIQTQLQMQIHIEITVNSIYS